MLYIDVNFLFQRMIILVCSECVNNQYWIYKTRYIQYANMLIQLIEYLLMNAWASLFEEHTHLGIFQASKKI